MITGLGLQILAQEAPKGSQEATKTLRKGSRELPRAPLEGPRGAQGSLKTILGGLWSTFRGPREAPKGFRDSPQRLSEGFRSAFTKFSLYNRLQIDFDEIWTRLGLNCTAYVLDD